MKTMTPDQLRCAEENRFRQRNRAMDKQDELRISEMMKRRRTILCGEEDVHVESRRRALLG